MTALSQPSSTILSVADLGSNTVKITHAQLGPDGSIIEMLDVAETIRLGAGIETTGRIDPLRIDSCVEILSREEQVGRQFGSERFIGVATEALRVASNSEKLLDRIRSETSWQVATISGDEEARLTYIGLKDRLNAEGHTIIVDIGGGSTEMVLIRNGAVTARSSIPLGSGRLADRLFRVDPPGADSMRQASSVAMRRVQEVSLLPESVETVLFSGGNGVYISSLIEHLFPGEQFSAPVLERLLQHLAVTPAQDIADCLRIVHERARVLPAGVAIAYAVLSTVDVAHAAGVPSGIRLGLIREHATR